MVKVSDVPDDLLIGGNVAQLGNALELRQHLWRPLD